MIHNKISLFYQPAPSFSGLDRGSGWGLCPAWENVPMVSDQLGGSRYSRYPLRLCCRCPSSPGVTGVSGAASVLGVTKIAGVMCAPGVRGAVGLAAVWREWVQQIPRVQKMQLVKGLAPGSHEADGWESGRVRGSLNHELSPPSEFSPTRIARVWTPQSLEAGVFECWNSSWQVMTS